MLGINDVNKMFVVAATAYEIEEAMSFRMFKRPTFYNVLKPLHKRDNIINVDSKTIRKETMKMKKMHGKKRSRISRGSPCIGLPTTGPGQTMNHILP